MIRHQGGHAFPTRVGEEEGLSVRDYFAAKALASLIIVNEDTHGVQTVERAWKLADMMIEQREKDSRS